MKNELILFETADKEIKLNVSVKDSTVWLNRNQLAELFERDVKTIGKHINNALREELESDKATVAKFATVELSNSSCSALLICLPIVLMSRSKSSASCERFNQTLSPSKRTSNFSNSSGWYNMISPCSITFLFVLNSSNKTGTI